jgi:hypothetical protein
VFNHKNLLSIFILLFGLSAFAQNDRTAFDVWSMLKESESSFKATEIDVFNAHPEAIIGGNTHSTVTFGAEKEGSSSVVTRVMGPSSETFLGYVEEWPEEKQKAFLSELMDGYAKGRYREREVTDAIQNVSKNMDLTEFRGVDFHSMSLEDVKLKFKKFLELSEDRPFSFLTKGTRSKIFNGKMEGQTQKLFNNSYHQGYDGGWRVNWGSGQKYITGIESTSNGWELLFEPQKSYGEFEEMISWFKQTLNKNGKLFEAPGHQRLVYPRPNLAGEALEVFDDHMKEVYKSLQGYIILKELNGKTGVEFSSYKSVFNDATLSSQYDEVSGWGGDRGVIRFEQGRWGENTFGIELRTGTKSPRTQRFVQQVISSRVASSDFSNISKASAYTLIPDDIHNTENLAKRFGLEADEVTRFYEKINGFQNYKGKGVKIDILAPLYLWENAPYISKEKAKQVKDISADWIKSIANNDAIGVEDFRRSLQQWTRSTTIERDIERYLSPLEQYNPGGNPAHFNVPEGALVDVNKIDLGIEYSGRFPIKYQGQFTDELAHGKKEWVQTIVDLTDTEREGYIRKVAQSLEKRLKPGQGSNVKRIVEENAHGHGLSIAYEFEDAQSRTWRLEWDGIGRSYYADGSIIENSQRSGHIELVTPKFQPTYKEMESVFLSFDKYGIIPSTKMGGGHVNIDLAAFKGKPKKLARFLSIYHENRGVMSMMFQDYGRYKSAEAIEISDNLKNQLKDFNGTEDELKKLLYNEKYYNQRVGRKTRYIGLDMSAYYQDVIPEKLLHADFDIANPTELWREQFRVNPKIRKMEFRMFNAPRSAYESGLQMKLVRAMMSKALNDDDALSGIVQDVDYERFARDTDYADEMLEKMCRQIDLDPKEYKVFLNEGTSDMQLRMKSPFYQNIEQRLAVHPKINTWGKALDTPRTSSNAINSENKIWLNGESALDQDGNFKPVVSQESQHYYKQRQIAMSQVEQQAQLKLQDAKKIFARHQCAGYLRPLR